MNEHVLTLIQFEMNWKVQNRRILGLFVASFILKKEEEWEAILLLIMLAPQLQQVSSVEETQGDVRRAYVPTGFIELCLVYIFFHLHSALIIIPCSMVTEQSHEKKWRLWAGFLVRTIMSVSS